MTSLDLAVFHREGQNDQPTHQLYREFVKKNKYICPFCGLRRLRMLGAYVGRISTTICTNRCFRLQLQIPENLVPTCGICNQDYKGHKNILADGSTFYPYGAVPPVELKVECERLPLADDLDDKGEWSVTIRPSVADATVTSKIGTWDRVYKIRERLVKKSKSMETIG